MTTATATAKASKTIKWPILGWEIGVGRKFRSPRLKCQHLMALRDKYRHSTLKEPKFLAAFT